MDSNAVEDLWLVVFCDPEPLDTATASRRDRLLYWCLRFLKPGFRHVFALRPARGFDGWLVVNPHAACLDVLEVAGQDYVNLVRQREAEGHCTLLDVMARRPQTWQRRGVMSCVSVVSHMLGIKCGLFASPWRLYCRLSDQSEVSPRL